MHVYWFRVLSYVPVAWMGVSIVSYSALGRSLTSEVLQQLDFSERTLGQDLLAEDIGDLLDGNALLGLVVLRRAASG